MRYARLVVTADDDYWLDAAADVVRLWYVGDRL
jgi:hypothetical protein